MPSLGKELRLRRFFRPSSGRAIMLAVSHGTSTPVIFPELEHTPELIDASLAGGTDSVLLSKGFLAASAGVFAKYPDKGVVLKVSSSAQQATGPLETIISSVETAALVGADAVGVLMQLTPTTEAHVIAYVAALGERCEALQIPLIVEAELPAAYDTTTAWYPDDIVAYLRRSCRLAQELGADVVKTNWTGSIESYQSVLSTVTVPVVVAGGARTDDATFLAMVRDALTAGAAGVSVGRNIFRAPDPQAATQAVADLVHGTGA
ncbi:MAG: hypothetical protein WCK58_10340 [Chloroflexota bacterium]